jgi:hypothetical protein
MTPRTFTVETRSQAVVIFGGPKSLTASLIQDLLARGVHAARISSEEELELLRQTHDPDYLVVFLDGANKDLFRGLQLLIDSGESRLITVGHFGSDPQPLSLSPVSKQIFYSDYVGDAELESLVLENWIKNLRSHNSLVVAGDGLGEVSLLTLGDLSRLLSLAILYPSTISGEIFSLGNPTPLSLLGLAYLVRTSLPFKTELVFTQNGDKEEWSYDAESLASTLDKLSYELIDNVETELKFYFKSLKIDPASPRSLPVSPSLVKPQKLAPNPILASLPPKRLTPLRTPQPFFVPLQERKTRKPLALKLKLPSFAPRAKQVGPPRLRTIVSRGLIIALALYLGTLAFSATVAGLSLGRLYNSLRFEELPPTNKLNVFAVTYLRANWLVLTSVPGLSKNNTVTEINTLLDVYSQALSAFTTADSLSKSLGDLTGYIFGSSTKDPAQVISLSRLQAEEFYQQLSLLDGSLPADPPRIIPSKYQPSYQEGKERLSKLKRGATTTKALLATLPDVIGLGGRRKYAVLFQNNMELRATGGFIGSFAIISFENGKLYDMPIYDVYDADGQLKGHVEPPLPIKEILGEANWYLRDSNFDPDFPTSARRAEWFIKKSLNQDLDGTIAVDVNTLISLIKATGPLDVADYNETITGDNLYERSQFHAEVNFFPGSTQKKEFLSTVASALFAKLPSISGGLAMKAVGALADSVQEKNTLIALVAPAADRIFKTLGWNGELSDFPCPSSLTCHKDYAMVVDSNFGVNKANYFIQRDIEEVITFDKNLAVNHVLRLSYRNASTSTAWPAGAYKNYQRLYLPIGSNITSIKVGDKLLSPKDYQLTSEHNKFVVAYSVLVPISTKLVVEIEYSTPQLPQENESLYTWYWQKQPGTSSADTVRVYLNYPMYLRPVVISPQAEVAPQQLKFDFVNDTDHRLTVKFTK